MKIILIISLLLIGMIGWGQEAKIDNWYFLQNGVDTANFYEYVYDSKDSLQYIFKQDYNHNTIITYTYEDGYCIKTASSTMTYNYEYLIDTIIEKRYYQGNSLYRYYTIGDYNNVIRYSSINTYEWNEGNLMVGYLIGDTSFYRSYYTNYINPWYQENKYFRYAYQMGFKSGSYNLINHQCSVISGSTAEFNVIESIGPFPTIIEYTTEEKSTHTIHINYHEINLDIPEIPSDSYKVLSVDYYDIMGRKIPKPTRGFYIEHKTTDKGVRSKKHYIQ